MFTTKTFIKKNKIGNFLKNVREHYIRDDISCGFHSCKKCYSSESSLSPSHKNNCTLYSYNHYLILDTNVILDQMDVLEESALGNVIILHTVLNEVKHRSLPIYKRLHSVIENPTRHFYVFINDHHKDTYLPQEDYELVNDYNDRCIRKACSWYIEHLPNEKFVFLTDDVQNRNIALSENIPSCSVGDYVTHLEDNQILEDKLTRKEFHGKDNTKDIFPLHLTNVQILNGIKEGKLYQGTFRASRDNFLEGSISVDAFDDPILLQGRDGLNRAVDGDAVAVEVFDESEWMCPSEIVLEDEGVTEENVDDVIEKEIELKKSAKGRKIDTKPTGRVVGIIRRKWRQYCGILQPGMDGVYQLFVPANRCIPKIRIETRQAEFLRTQKLIVTIDSWPRNSRYPHGHFVRSLGKIGDQSTENEVILLEHDVPHSQFSEEVLSCLPKLPWIITDELMAVVAEVSAREGFFLRWFTGKMDLLYTPNRHETWGMDKDVKRRVDLRHINICSVDPPGCTDIDDALHCRPIADDKLEVGVHIADVSHFIRPGTAIDIEAASRATTVYLVNKRIDMVPELLSSNLCSLRGGEVRFAFSCIWEMDKKANILNTRFHKSIIESKQAMTYEEAQLTIDDKSKTDAIAESLRNLNMLAKILKQRRLDNGALQLASPEVKIHMDSETMEPLNVEVKTLFETNSMVEEFMLLANISVAEKILEDFPDCAMLRRHPVPPSTNFDPLIKAARHLGFELEVDSNKNLAKSLDEAVLEANPYFNTMLRILATRCMMQAVYFPSGTLQKEEFYHYGLAVPLYTHFTSPIRRYADIIVHRLLAVSCGADATYPDLLDKQKSSNLCQNLNYRNRMAQYAGRASVAFNTHLFFKGKNQTEEGYVLFVRKNALQILIPKYGLECTLFLTNKGEKSSIFEYNEEDQTQRAGDIIIHAFDQVTVKLRLDSNNIQHEKFVLHLVKPYIEKFSISEIEETNQSESMQTEPLETCTTEPSKPEKSHKKGKKRKSKNFDDKKSKEKKK